MYHFNEVYIPAEQKAQESSSLLGKEKRKKKGSQTLRNTQFKSHLKNQ